MDIDYEDNNRSYDELPTKEQNLKFTVLEEKMKKILHIHSFNEDILKVIGAIGMDGKYSNAGALLADTNPFGGIECTRYGNTENIILDHETFDHRSVLRQYDDAISFFRIYYQYDVIEGSIRRTVEKIPEKAFREAIADALVNRIWDSNAPIRVEMFDDRIEVSSPGSLPGEITEKEYLEGKVPFFRNPILAGVFCRLHLKESFGTGTRKIHEAYQDSDAKPVCSILRDAVTIMLPLIKTEKALSKPEKTVYGCLGNVGKASSEIAGMAGFGKNKTLGILSALEQQGYVRKTGRGRGTRYSINQP